MAGVSGGLRLRQLSTRWATRRHPNLLGRSGESTHTHKFITGYYQRRQGSLFRPASSYHALRQALLLGSVSAEYKDSHQISLRSIGCGRHGIRQTLLRTDAGVAGTITGSKLFVRTYQNNGSVCGKLPKTWAAWNALKGKVRKHVYLQKLCTKIRFFCFSALALLVLFPICKQFDRSSH